MKYVFSKLPNTRHVVSAKRPYMYVFAAILLNTASVTWSAGSHKEQISAGPPSTILEGMKEQVFLNAYRRAFAPYLGLKWVAKPSLENVSKKVLLNDGREVSVFFACRPHACGNEKLSFIFEPVSGKGWGLIHIKSDVGGDAPINSVEAILERAMETEK